MRKYLDISLTLIVATVLTVAMLWPNNQLPKAPDGTDKVLHLIAFTVLVFPLANTGRIGLIPVFIGASIFGGLIEIMQPLLGEKRGYERWIADIAGVTLGIAISCSRYKLRDYSRLMLRK